LRPLKNTPFCPIADFAIVALATTAESALGSNSNPQNTRMYSSG